MKLSRRKFLKTSAMAGAGFAMFNFGVRRGLAASISSPNLSLFAQPLRGGDVLSLATEIGVANSDGIAPATGALHYTLKLEQFTDQLHPSLAPTTLWGFVPQPYLVAGPATPRHLGGIFVVQKNNPVQVTFVNNLPINHPIPIDITVPGDWAGTAGGAMNRIAVHMHGGHVPWLSDGGPFDWWRADGTHGLVFINNETLNPANVGTNKGEYYYPNDQSARLMWYHDHAFGMDRNSAYAGVASAYVIRDNFELNLGLPRIETAVTGAGVLPYELPIVVQDKQFCGSNILLRDPTWTGSTASPGDLWYAHTYDTALYGKLGPAPQGPPPDPSCVPEYFGDTMLANGLAYPTVNVEPRRYRLRILNACNSRFLNLQLLVADASANGITLGNGGVPLNGPARNPAAANPQGKPTSNFLVIGTEGGLLPKPAFVPMNLPLGGSLLLAPAERADVLMDFSLHKNQKLILYNDAAAPFPGGSPLNDYFPGLANKNPVNMLTPAGKGPNTRIIMQFVVGASVTAPADPPLTIGRATDFTTMTLGGEVYNDPLLVPPGVTALPPGVTVRPLTLNEGFDTHGRLAQLLGRNVFNPATGGFGEGYLECGPGGGERATAGTTEIWQIANLSADTHPIHFHLVNVQIISRQKFSVGGYKGIANAMGPPIPPLPYEAGWKETVRMNPGEVTTVIMKFGLPTVPFVIPPSPRTGGHEYVWHCHILEHEEHDMMRPLVVT